MFDNSGLVKLRRMGVVMYCWIKNATRRKKEPCTKCRKRKVQKMLSLQPSAMDRLNHELSVQRDRFVRLQSVRNDLALDLPHSIPLPDGEEIPYGSSTRLQIRDPQQESEIYQKCIRPPPNRTIVEGDPPPPYLVELSRALARSERSNKKSSVLFDRTVRCLGLKRHEERPRLPPPPPPPCVHVPIYPNQRSRQLAAFAERGSMNLASVPTVSCAVPAQYMAANRPGQAVPEAYPGDKMRSHSSGVATGVAPRAPAPAAAAGAAAAAAAPICDTKGPEKKSAAAAAAAAGPSGLSPNEQCDTKAIDAELERAAVASAAAGGPSGFYPTEQCDTKGPETRQERAAAAAAAGYPYEYLETKAAEKRFERGSTAGASGSASNEHRDTKGAEKKSDKGSV